MRKIDIKTAIQIAIKTREMQIVEVYGVKLEIIPINDKIRIIGLGHFPEKILPFKKRG